MASRLHIGLFLAAALIAQACSSAGPAVTEPPVRVDPDWTSLDAQLAEDLAVLDERDAWRRTGRSISRRLGEELRPGSVLADLMIPVEGVRGRDLRDSFGAPRDAGKRKHKGIDIFAPKGTKVVAVSPGVITYIGEQRLGGKCIWLRAPDGSMFYYAHLDRWVGGLREGMEVDKGETLGYVGNTGNARTTPPHLHFQIVSRSATVNPYPVLVKSAVAVSRPLLGGGFGRAAASSH